MLTERPADTSSDDPPIDSDSARVTSRSPFYPFLSLRSCAALSPFQPGNFEADLLACCRGRLHDCTTQQASRSAFPAGEGGESTPPFFTRVASPPGRVLCSVAERFAAAVLRGAPKTSLAMALVLRAISAPRPRQRTLFLSFPVSVS